MTGFTDKRRHLCSENLMNRYIHKTSVSESADEELEDVGGFLAFFCICPTFHTNSDSRYYIFTTAILTNPTIVFAF